MAELAKVPGLRWRLYYADGSTFDNLDGEPWESPPWGVVGVVQTHSMWNAERLGQYPPQEQIYIYREDCGRWSFHGPSGRDDQFVHFAHVISAYRIGRYVPSADEWNALRARMDNDPDFYAPLQKERRELDNAPA